MNLTASIAVTKGEQRKGPQCGVGALLDKLDATEPDQAAILRGALADEGLPYATLSRALALNGVRLASTSLARHAGRSSRPRECSCTA